MNIKAYAKVNLILNILGKRDDGYHEIETLMHAIDLHDDVDVEIIDLPLGFGRSAGCDECDVSEEPDTSIILKCSSECCEKPSDNLAFKAASLMKEYFNKSCGISINIEKRIPLAAGLAGGSADAAAVVNALARLWDIDDKKALLDVCAKLGSDVSFSFAAQNGVKDAVARGRGELLEEVDPVNLQLNLKVLDIQIPNKTRAVYSELKPEDYRCRYNIEDFLNAKDIREQDALMGNHLQAPAFRVFRSFGFEIPDYPRHLSGAGPTLFGIAGLK